MTAERVLNDFSLDLFSRFLQGLWRRRAARHICQFQVGGRDALPVSHDDGPLNAILQLTDVAGPTVKSDRAQCIWREGYLRFAMLRAKTVQEFLRYQSDVVSSLA